MGPKITIDSATLVNKAFEVIEARWLYRLPYSKIDAVIHPQSVVHSLVEFADGSYKAQLGLPDMRLPIQYALTYPERLPSPAASAGPADWGSLDFAPLADADYPAYAVTRAAAEAGGNRGVILNAADEVAVEAFLAGADSLPGHRRHDRRRPSIAGARRRSPTSPEIIALDAEVRSTLAGGARLMEVIGTVGAFIAILVVLVLVHELGHFITAKRAGITVEEFGIGFPPRITSITWHGTRYSLNWIPLGGFVRMLGEDGDVEIRRLRESGLTDAEIDHAMEGAFNRRPIWVRVGVLLAGVAMNFLLAGVAFSWAAAMPQPLSLGPLHVLEIQADSPAEAALEVGDTITAADGQTFEQSRDLTSLRVEPGRRAGHADDHPRWRDEDGDGHAARADR